MNNDFNSIKESLGQDLNTDINNLIGEVRIGTPEESVTSINSLGSGLRVSMDIDQITVPAYHINIPEDALSLTLDESGENIVSAVINPDFVEEYRKAQQFYDSVKAELDNAKAMMLKFIEDNNTGTIKSNGMMIKYSPATTTTSIDSKALKSKFPDIAAEFSKVSARKSSISVELK